MENDTNNSTLTHTHTHEIYIYITPISTNKFIVDSYLSVRAEVDFNPFHIHLDIREQMHCMCEKSNSTRCEHCVNP